VVVVVHYSLTGLDVIHAHFEAQGIESVEAAHCPGSVFLVGTAGVGSSVAV
jgi:hypothetical protein